MRFAEQAPEGSKEPTDLTLAGEGLKGCGDSGLLIQATHNHVSSCGFQFRGAPHRKHDSPDFFVLSLIQAEVVSPVRSVPRG